MPDAGLDIDFGTGDSPGGDPEEKALRALRDYQVTEAGADAELAAIQGAVAAAAPESEMTPVAVDGKAVPPRMVELLGKRFRIADKVGLMPMLKFSAFADMEVQDARALGAMYAMLRDVIHADDWRAFEDHAIDSKAEADDLLDVISRAIEQISGRPTGQPGPSSRGPRGISGGSTAGSSSRRGKGSRR